MREIARGNPLPPYQLSEEALRRRQERLAADEVRQKQTKKKPLQNSLLEQYSQKAAAPASNSVAAKRLAAKRGMPTTNNFITSTTANTASASEPLFEASFDAFDSNPPQHPPSHQQQKFADEEDDLPTYHAPAVSSGQRLQTADALFDDDDDKNAAVEEDLFAAAPPLIVAAHAPTVPSNVVSDFDPFGQQQLAPAPSGQDNEEFDVFAPDAPLPAVAPVSPRRAVTAPAPKHAAPESLFANFDDDDTPPPQPGNCIQTTLLNDLYQFVLL